jgi:hypothetical protein
MAIQQSRGVSGLQMADVSQKKILAFLCDHRCKSEEMQEWVIPIDA